jgi:hypothetical protein
MTISFRRRGGYREQMNAKTPSITGLYRNDLFNSGDVSKFDDITAWDLEKYLFLRILFKETNGRKFK